MNRLQIRFLRDGEVSFKLGLRFWCFVLITLASGALLIALGVTGLSDVPIAAVLLLLLGVLVAGYGLVLGFNPRRHALNVVRFSRWGIETSGIRVPWQSIDRIESHAVLLTRFFFQHQQLVMLRPDGPPVLGGEKLAQAVNEAGSLRLLTHRHNVSHRTLLEFLRWA